MKNDNLNNEMLNLASKQLGVNPRDLKNAGEGGDINSILSRLPKSQADKVKSVLSDKKELNRIMNSEKAKKLMQLFGGTTGER